MPRLSARGHFGGHHPGWAARLTELARLARLARLVSVALSVPAAALLILGTLVSVCRAELWEGWNKLDFEVDGRAAFLIQPHAAAAGRPWIWRTEFFGHQPQADKALLEHGFHVAYIDIQNLYGGPAAMSAMDAMYHRVTQEFKLSRKTVLEGFSRGGLFSLNWAARQPDKVAAIYNDAPVCDFKSWPAGRGQGPGSPADWERCKAAYGFTSDQEALAYRLNPVDNLKPLAAARIPLLHVCGADDQVVPIDENSRLLEARYRALGGTIQLIAKPNCGHHPHSLPDPKPIVDFVLAHTRSPNAWREFRGDTQAGTALDQQPPLEWSEDKNMLWKTSIHGLGWSSPVVAEDQIWLNTASEDGKKMSVLCVSLATGQVIHDRLVFENETVQPDHHVTNSYASPTPVLNDRYVYAHFGAYGTACLDRQTANLKWQRRDLPCNHYRGPGSSPILYENLLIFHMDGFDHQYVVALNQETGETVWKRNRDIDYGTDNGDYYKAYSTPLIIQVGGVDQMVSSTSKATLVLNPRTGEEFWRVTYPEFSATARPLFDGQHVFLNTGFGKAQMLCVQADGKGDVTANKVLWSQKRGIGSKPSQILVQGKLYSVTDDGVLSRIDTASGQLMWQKRLGGNFSASLVATRDHLFAFDHDGRGYALTVADEPELVSENSLPDGCRASPAIVDNSLIVRTITHLYRFKKP